MLNLNQKLREQHGARESCSPSPSSPFHRRLGGGSKSSSPAPTSAHQVYPASSSHSPVKDSSNRISIRDKLLVQEVTELSCSLPSTCHVHFPSQSDLSKFELAIRPEPDSLYSGGVFKFLISIPLEYNNVPPQVKCLTRIWHPNISEDGSVCLSLLRQTSMDGLGWSPTRRLKDVVLGLNSLFTDLLDFDDPLNIEASEHYYRDQTDFEKRVKDYIRRYCERFWYCNFGAWCIRLGSFASYSMLLLCI